MKSPRKKILLSALGLLVALGIWWYLSPSPAVPPSPVAPLAGVALPPAPLAPTPEAEAVGSTPVAPVVAPVQPVAPTASTVLPAPDVTTAASLGGAPATDSRPAPADEPAATARMYAAHAPLRVPEVADPDSISNQRILHAMVNKALAAPASPPPTASTSARN